MDFLDFKAQDLYFDEPVEDEVEKLLTQAALEYGTSTAENKLHKAFFMAPENLQVHVALYRYYFYQHKLEQALHVAHITLKVAGGILNMPHDWRQLLSAHLGVGAVKSMGLVRYYFLALKAAGYINIRMGNTDEGITMLQKVAELDSADRLGAKALLTVVAYDADDLSQTNYMAH